MGKGRGRGGEQNNSVLQTGNAVSSSPNWANEPASCLILRGAIGYLEFHRRHEPIDFPIARQFHFSFLFFPLFPPFFSFCQTLIPRLYYFESENISKTFESEEKSNSCGIRCNWFATTTTRC